MEDDIAHIPATVDDLFQKFVEVSLDDRAQRIEMATVQLAQQHEHQLIGFALEILEAIVPLLDLLEIGWRGREGI